MNPQILRELQLTELEILKKVHEVCEQNGITYYFVGGTLLGAMRHKGFIPWDDDLDIAMPRHDYNRFLALCQDGALGEKYYLQHTVTDPEYWLPFAKVRKNNTLFDEDSYKNIETHKGIFIDIFPLDYCKKNSGIIFNLRAKTIKKISYIIQMRKLSRPTVGPITSLLFQITKPLTIKQLSEFHDYLCSRFDNGSYLINYGSNYKYQKQTMVRDIYEPAVKVEFEDAEFYAPNQPIRYLESLFKNWKQLPPEEERRNHNPSIIIFDTTVKGK